MTTKPNTSLWTFRKYVEQIFIPAKVESGRSVASLRLYRTLLVRFLEYCGREIKCREVTEAVITGFVPWLLDHGFRKSTAETYRYVLRAILRHWNPEKYQTQDYGGKASTNFIDADLPGTLEQLFVAHYAPENSQITSARTRVQYGLVFRLFTEFLGHAGTLADLTDANCVKFARWCIDVRGNRPITARINATRLKAVWNWAAKKRLVAQFPTFSNLPIPESIPSAWTREQLTNLIGACRRAPGMIGRIPAAKFWLAYHYVLWDSMERYGAVRKMRWEWVDLRRGFITVPAEFRKGGRKAMVYHLKPETIAALKDIRSPAREDVFETPWGGTSGTMFYHYYKKLILSAGLPYERNKSGPQKMRRSAASHLEALGGNATRALRHSDRRTTEKSYLDPRVCETEPENQKLFALDGDAA